MEKNSRGKTIVIIILVLLVLGLGGYIVYDKVISKGATEPIKIEMKKENGLLNKDEALEIGKERYEYVRDGLYLCGYKQVKYDDSQLFAWSDIGKQTMGDLKYAKVTNVEDIKDNLTMHTYINWLKSLDVKKDGNDHYMNIEGCGIGPDYAYDKFEIKVKDIKKDYIVYSVDEYFYTSDNNGIITDVNKAEKYTIDFEILKENNVWKIKEYTDAQDVYYNKS